MKKRINKSISFLLVIVILLSSLSGCIVSNKDTSSDENSSEEEQNNANTQNAYKVLIDKLCANGILDADYDENSNVSNQLFISMLVIAFDFELSDDTTKLNGVDDIFIPYCITALNEGVISYNNFATAKDTASGTDVIYWTRKAMCCDKGQDDLFANIGEGVVTIKQAAELLCNAYARFNVLFSIREDAANTIILQDRVFVTSSSSSKNIISQIDADNLKVTFSNADEIVKNINTGEILYITPSKAMPSGFLAKITEKTDKGETVTVACETPKINEVIKEADISTVLSVNGDLGVDNSQSIATESGKEEGKEKEDNLTLEYYSYYEGDVYRTDNGLKWKVIDTENFLSDIHFETANFKDKDRKGIYAEADLGIDIFVDFMLFGTSTEITKFEFSTYATSTITALAGYTTSKTLTEKDKEIEIELESVTIPISGPLSIEITPKMIIRGEGEFTIEVTPTIKTDCSFIANKSGVTYGCTPKATVDLHADGEGTAEAGVGLDIELSLMSLKIFDKIEIDLDINITEIEVIMGIGLYGSVVLDLSLDSDEGIVHKPDENGKMHMCTICVGGNIYAFAELQAGLDKDLRDLLKELFSFEALYTMPKNELVLYEWYYSIGEGHDPEFGKGKCPYQGYEITINVIDDNTKKPIPNVKLLFEDKYATCDENGTAIVYAENGAYTIAAVSNFCTPVSVNKTISVSGEAITVEIVMNRTLDYYKFIAETLVPQYGLAMLENKTGDIYVYENKLGDSQYNGRGLASAKIVDINNDSVEDLVVCYYKECVNEYENKYTDLVLSLYTVDEKGKIVKMTEDVELSWRNSIDNFAFCIGITEIDGKNYIITESALETLWYGGGNFRCFDMYGFDESNNFKKLYMVNDGQVRASWGWDSAVFYHDFTANPDGDSTDITEGNTKTWWKAYKNGLNMMGININIEHDIEYPKLFFRNFSGADLLFASELNMTGSKYTLTFIEYTQLQSILENY